MNLLLSIVVLAAPLVICGLGAGSGPASNSGTTSQSTPSAPTPLDRDAVRSEVVGFANDILNAAHKGDAQFLERATTEDFESTDIDGKVQSKRQALADVRQEKAIKDWAITEPELSSFDDKSAVLRYVLDVTGSNARRIKVRVNDTYVRRDGRWLLRSQQMTLLK